MRLPLRLFSRVALLVFAALVSACNSHVDDPWETVPSHVAGSSRSQLTENDLIPTSRVSSTCSAMFVGGFVDVSFGAMFLAAVGFMLLHRRRARSEAALDRDAPLRDGPTVIFGVVELESDDGEPAVQVQIHQAGSEASNKGNWSYSWSEVSREVRARPFLVRRKDGSVVRVEPDKRRIALKDALSRLIPGSDRKRTRIAELTAGEHVYVTGALRGVGQAAGSPYRGAPGSPRLLAPPFGTMLISTERPGATETQRARFHFGWALGLALMFTLINVLLIPSYHALVLDGVPVRVAPTATQHWREWVKPKNSSGYWQSHWRIRGELRAPGATPTPLEDECAQQLYVDVKRGSDAPFLVAEHAPWLHQVGFRPAIQIWTLILLLLGVSTVLVVYPATAVSTRPWYARKKVSNGGNGRLAEAMDKT